MIILDQGRASHKKSGILRKIGWIGASAWFAVKQASNTPPRTKRGISMKRVSTAILDRVLDKIHDDGSDESSKPIDSNSGYGASPPPYPQARKLPPPSLFAEQKKRQRSPEDSESLSKRWQLSENSRRSTKLSITSAPSFSRRHRPNWHHTMASTSVFCRAVLANEEFEPLPEVCSESEADNWLYTKKYRYG